MYASELLLRSFLLFLFNEPMKSHESKVHKTKITERRSLPECPLPRGQRNDFILIHFLKESFLLEKDDKTLYTLYTPIAL